MRGDIKMSGLDQMSALLRRLEVAGKGAKVARPALAKNSEKMMTNAKKYAPVDTGHLRDSGHVRYPNPAATRTTVTLTFDADYALPVHERLDLVHPTGQAKFLERAVNEGMDDLTRDVGEAMASLAKGAARGR